MVKDQDQPNNVDWWKLKFAIGKTEYIVLATEDGVTAVSQPAQYRYSIGFRNTSKVRLGAHERFVAGLS